MGFGREGERIQLAFGKRIRLGHFLGPEPQGSQEQKGKQDGQQSPNEPMPLPLLKIHTYLVSAAFSKKFSQHYGP